MAAIGNKTPKANLSRVSPLKPSLRGARNWAKAQLRAASYSRKSFWRLMFSVIFVVGLIFFGALWLGGFLPDARNASHSFVKNRLVAMGFVVDRVDVMGEGRLHEQDIHIALGVYPGDYLFEMDVKAAQKRVEALNWVDKAVVRRLWPDRVVVQIIERKPYALWQNKGHITLIDAKGVAIDKTSPEQYPSLTLIVGPKANEFLGDVNLIESKIDLSGRVSGYVRNTSGRWDIYIDDGRKKIMLPHSDLDLAISRLSSLQDVSRILDREVSVIDLRLTDRLTLKPSKESPA